VSNIQRSPDWWQASDGKWYDPKFHPQAQQAPPSPTTPAPPGEAVEEGDAGQGQFGDGVTTPLYEFTASRFKGGRMFSPNVIRVWSDRIEEYEHHAVLKKNTESINFHQVAQVKVRKGLRYSDVSVESTGGHSIVMKGVPKGDGDRVKGIIDEAVHAARTGAVQVAPPQAAPAPAPVSVADELIKLAQLRDAGVLSPEEFEEQKARAMLPPA